MNKGLLIKILIGVLILGVGIAVLKSFTKKGLKENEEIITPSVKTQPKISFLGANVCNLIPKELVQEAIGREIVKTEWVELKTIKYCSYYTLYKEDFYGPGQAGGANIVIGFSNEDIETLKKDLQRTGNEFITDNRLSINHYLIKSSGGKIWQVILFLNNEWYLGIKANHEAASGEELIKIALKILEKKPEFFSSKTTTETKQSSVPLPQEGDIIMNFAELIKEKRPEDAVKMMKIENKNEAEMWAVQFAAMNEIEILEIEKANEDKWTKNTHYYKVVFDIKMDPKSAEAPIPYYGWNNGENVRWLTLEKVNNVWKIANITSSP